MLEAANYLKIFDEFRSEEVDWNVAENGNDEPEHWNADGHIYEDDHEDRLQMKDLENIDAFLGRKNLQALDFHD